MAQQGSDNPPSILTTELPKAFTGRQYDLQLQAQGGSPPLKWRLASGSLPNGIALSADGMLSGTPRESGEFHFVVTVADTTIPARERNQELVLQVLGALVVEWSRHATVVGQRVEGSVKISNQTEDDFDLTFVVVAVNDNGRATALGYQRFTLKKGTIGMEIPFGETLPTGAYEVNVDVVAEVPSTNTIRRRRLVTADKLTVQQP
jgi:Putative Ig domain